MSSFKAIRELFRKTASVPSYRDKYLSDSNWVHLIKYHNNGIEVEVQKLNTALANGFITFNTSGPKSEKMPRRPKAFSALRKQISPISLHQTLDGSTLEILM